MANKYTGSNTGNSGLEVTEVDGVPDVFGVTKITVSNGDLTNDGDGAVTIDTTGSGGTPGGSDTQIQYNNATSFGGIADFTWDDTDLTIGGTTPATKLKFRDDALYIDGATDGKLSLTSDGSIGLTVGAAGVVVSGTTPKVTIGDAGSEDTSLVFDGSATDFYMGLDDTDSILKIGIGSTVGADTILSITADKLKIGDNTAVDTMITFTTDSEDFYIGCDDSTDTMVIGNGTGISANAWGSSINIDTSDNVRIPIAKITALTVTTTVGSGDNPSYVGQTLTMNQSDLTLNLDDGLPVGSQLVVINLNSSPLTIAGLNAQTVAGTTSVSQYKAVTLVMYAADTWVSIGE